MRTVGVMNHLTLDGVMQGPGREDEDRRDGFAHGGWAGKRNAPEMAKVMGERLDGSAELLLGRRTYEDFASFWPKQPRPNPFSDALDGMRKYVASTTLTEPLPWQNSTLLAGDAADAVAEMRRRPGPYLGIFGSGELVRSLMARDLIDEFVLMIHPIVLGSGRKLFTEGMSATLRLVGTVTTDTGVVIATFRADRPDRVTS